LPGNSLRQWEQEKIADGIEMIETQPGISMPEALGETYDA
jgi:hypothetical protein